AGPFCFEMTIEAGSDIAARHAQPPEGPGNRPPSIADPGRPVKRAAKRARRPMVGGSSRDRPKIAGNPDLSRRRPCQSEDRPLLRLQSSFRGAHRFVPVRRPTYLAHWHPQMKRAGAELRPRRRERAIASVRSRHLLLDFTLQPKGRRGKLRAAGLDQPGIETT